MQYLPSTQALGRFPAHGVTSRQWNASRPKLGDPRAVPPGRVPPRVARFQRVSDGNVLRNCVMSSCYYRVCNVRGRNARLQSCVWRREAVRVWSRTCAVLVARLSVVNGCRPVWVVGAAQLQCTLSSAGQRLASDSERSAEARVERGTRVGLRRIVMEWESAVSWSAPSSPLVDVDQDIPRRCEPEPAALAPRTANRDPH